MHCATGSSPAPVCPVPLDWGEHLRQQLARQDSSAALDLISLAVIASGLLRSWAELGPADFLFLACYAAGSACMLRWRHSHPGSFARWRELPAALSRIAVAASPTAWVITRQALKGVVPFSAAAGLAAGCQNLAVYSLLLFFCSFAATGSVLALARPLRLWLHIPVHASAVLFIFARNGDICQTPVLQHPVAQQATARLYCGMSSLLALLSMPAGAARFCHGPVGQCRAVLALAELLLGFLAPTAVLAAQESRRFVQWQLSWQRWWQREAQRAATATTAAAAQEQAAGSSSWGAARPCTVKATRQEGRPAGGLEPELQPEPELQGEGEEVPAGAPPSLKPPAQLAAGMYRALAAGLQAHLQEPADWLVAAAMASLLLCSVWHAILLVTPAD